MLPMISLILSVVLGCSTIYALNPLHREGDDILTQAISRLQKLEESNAQLNNLVSELNKQIAKLEAQPELRHNSSIGFLAIPTTDENYNQNEQVKFQMDIFNPGDYYNSGSSTFMCPVSGYYWFSVKILCDSRLGFSDQMFGSIEVNSGERYIRATAKGRETNDQGSNSGIIYCNAGHFVRVIVETTATGTFRMIGSNESSFSGFLLYEGAV